MSQITTFGVLLALLVTPVWSFAGMVAAIPSARLLVGLSRSSDNASGSTYSWAALTGLWLGLAGASAAVALLRKRRNAVY